MINDVHTHNPNSLHGIINRPLSDDFIPLDGKTYSVGIHPWQAHMATEKDWMRLEKLSRNDNIVAIGEAGIDTHRGPALDIQIPTFIRQAKMSEESGKPLIIHCVGGEKEILAALKLLNPSRPWILHGFRGKPQQAETFLRHGLYISLGEKFNSETARIIPSDKLMIETDESRLPIETIRKRILDVRGQEMTIDHDFTKIFL